MTMRKMSWMVVLHLHSLTVLGSLQQNLLGNKLRKKQKRGPQRFLDLFNEIVVPAAESIGVKLLLKMGWRRGHSMKESNTTSLYDVRREARKAFLPLSANEKAAKGEDSDLVDNDTENTYSPTDDDGMSKSTPIYVLNPLQDLHGLGYNPFKHVTEFREKEKITDAVRLFGFKSGRLHLVLTLGLLKILMLKMKMYMPQVDFEEFYVEEIEGPSRPND